MKEQKKVYILGAGSTGLAAAYKLCLPIYEAQDFAGGICSSYYMSAQDKKRHSQRAQDQEDYRFEYGGGHWIFGTDKETLSFINLFGKTKKYFRHSSIFLPSLNQYIPYPIQNNLHYLPQDIQKKILHEIINPVENDIATLDDWLRVTFGETLYSLFFGPFHHLYTAGLSKYIAPQDTHKSPIDRESVILGSNGELPPVGYNVEFIYPEDGLGTLFARVGQCCDVRYGKKVCFIDVHQRLMEFEDGSVQKFDSLISTIPLIQIQELTKIETKNKPDPYTSILVINIGGTSGKCHPDDHWIYFPLSKAGFHRIGFYSNVEKSFLPLSMRLNENGVSMYVERAYRGGIVPSSEEKGKYCKDVIEELKDIGFLETADIVDQNWIDVAYTWKRPNSQWREEIIANLRTHGIHQIGRYGRWHFQGIAESIKEGLEFDQIITQ